MPHRSGRASLILFGLLSVCGCGTSPAVPEPSVPVPSGPGAFSVRVAPDPVVFTQMYPDARPLALATPPPPDPRYFRATMTLIITEQQGGIGHLDGVATALIASDGTVIPVYSFDGACDFQNELSRGGDRTIPPRGSLAWCLSRLATPDVGGAYTLRVSARITDGLGNVTSPTGDSAVVIQR
jgi:hypothetical protein